MVGKLTTVLTKKEAEAYCSQGLHKEALGLYQSLLSSSPNLGDSFKEAIQGQVDSIQSELQDAPNQEHQMLSVSEIKRIRKGWGENATEGDILVCAKAFCQVGHYQDALHELARLLQKKGPKKNVVELFADCLANLQTPEQLSRTIGPLGNKIIRQREERCRFYLLLTEDMVIQRQLPHAQALLEYLKKDPMLNQKAPQRLAAIAKGIERLETGDTGITREEAAPSTSKSTEENTELEAEPLSTETTKKKLFDWLPFFKKNHSAKEQS